MINKKLNYTSVDYLQLIPGGGSEITATIREATILALENGVTVKFTHNGGGVEIKPDDILNKYYDQWVANRTKEEQDE
jgi:hypothetical protein